MPGNLKRVIKKPTSAVSTLRQFLLVFIMILAVQPTAAISAQPALQQPGSGGQAALSGPQTVSTSAQACQWTYYPVLNGVIQPEQLLYNDTENTPIWDLSVGNLFKGKSAQLVTTGSTDFDGDNKTDVFRTLLRSDHNLQWQYSSGGTGAWQNLTYASRDLPTSELQFGNFNPDLKTDIFATQYNYDKAVYQWEYSSGGIFPFAVFNSASSLPPRLALGDFNGDGVTDVFTANPVADTYQWAYFPGGSGSQINLAPANTNPSLLRFGDFDGDGATDVFAALQQADGSYQWVYSSGGSAPYANLAATSVPYSELQFGDFNGDGTTDVMAAEPQGDGSLDVVYWPGGLGAGVSMGQIPAPAPALRVGDFNGDGTSDLMAYRCGMNEPLAFTPLQTPAQSGYSDFQNVLTGDVNGDGRADLILVSTCQNFDQFGHCATNYLQVGAALGTPTHTYTLAAAQELSGMDFSYFKVLAGDFDGDGKTDLALIDAEASSLTIYIAHSNGDGTFTLGSPQTTGVSEDWSEFNPIVGDFNGDGKTDLLFNSTCQKNSYSDATCNAGTANLVYTAISDGFGSFTLIGTQNYGSGWSDYSTYNDLIGDVNGDGRADLIWSSSSQTAAKTNNNQVVVGFANPSGTFQLGSIQNFGSAWSGSLSLADLNHDHKADLLWNIAPDGDTDVDTYAAATSNGNGTFKSLGQGSVYTGQGYFQLPRTGAASPFPTSLVIVASQQDAISGAIFVVNGLLASKIYLLLLKR